jgi:hypothetical protein
LFINSYTAVRTGPVSDVYVNEAVGMPVRRIREDRILHEAYATRGDVRRLCDLFGLSIKGAERYTSITGRLLRAMSTWRHSLERAKTVLFCSAATEQRQVREHRRLQGPPVTALRPGQWLLRRVII